MSMIRMSKSMILVVILVAVLATNEATAQAPTMPNFFDQFCRTKMGNYSTNSTYEANVISVLTDLYNQSLTASFSNSSAGGSASADQVFGQYHCRSDINTTLCNECIKEAAQTVYRNCHNFKAAVVWYEECTLRYDNETMVGLEAEFPRSWATSVANVTDPEKFGPVVNQTLARLINESAYGNSLPFATGEGVVSAFQTAYCLVQCSPDLDQTECDTCLRSAYDVIPEGWPQIVFVFFPSCHLRYTTQGAFYQLRNAPPPQAPSPVAPTSPSLPTTPPPPLITASPPPTGGTAKLGSREGLNLGLVISAIFFTFIRFG